MENEINTTGFERKKENEKWKVQKSHRPKKVKLKRKECWKRSIKFEINICDDDCDVLN